MYSTLQEALSAKDDLVARIQSIDVQLTEKAAKVTGRVPDDVYKEYLEWRARVVKAKATLVNRLARVKREVQRLRAAESDQRVKGRGGDKALLSDLYSLTKSLVAAGADISSEEQLLLDDVGHYLNE